MTSFIFVRHGKSQANLDGIIALEDSPLSKEGAVQARKTGRELKTHDITTIVTSPLPRARETAEIIAKELKIDPETIEVIDDLRERGLGSYKGHKKEEASYFYFTVDGQNDVEPRGVVIARCEAALSRIKKLSEQGTVLAVGHAVSGYYLQQVASGKRVLAEFDNPTQAANAKPIVVTINEPQRPALSKDAALAIGAILLGLVALVTAIILMMNQAKPAETGVKQQNIPLQPGDYQDDPNLQGAVQKLQEQQQAAQADGSAMNILQPNQGLSGQ
jgi:probable phosphoglycerate mutase